MTPQERFGQFQADFAALTYNDVKSATAIAFLGWLSAYGNYVENGGDRPKHKPPTA